MQIICFIGRTKRRSKKSTRFDRSSRREYVRWKRSWHRACAAVGLVDVGLVSEWSVAGRGRPTRSCKLGGGSLSDPCNQPERQRVWRVVEREPRSMLLIKSETTRREETVDEFIARGGRIQRIEQHPDPDGRVLLRGQRE